MGKKFKKRQKLPQRAEKVLTSAEKVLTGKVTARGEGESKSGGGGV